jgi:lantibiotic modifying enzyme
VSAPWRPLLSGDVAGQARATAQEIGKAVSGGIAHLSQDLSPEAIPVWENTLSGGRAGQCLLPAYLALDGAGDEYADIAIELLDAAVDASATLHMSASLYLGFPGIAWATAHLANRLFTEDEDGNLDVDNALVESLARSPWTGTYDLFNGLVGIGAYALERLPRASAERCLAAIVTQLAGLATYTPDGATFFSPVALLHPKYREVYPRGAYVLGMAQGIPGVIALLGATCRAGVATAEARPLLGAIVSWLLARELPPDSQSRFSHYHCPGRTPRRSRVAWCFGDLGIAAALLVAARGAGEPSWDAAARRIALAAAARPVAGSGVSDAGLCHGASGVGHVFNRLYQATGESDLARAARMWFADALSRRRPGRGICGFLATSGDERWDEPGFLIGAAGIGLALLAAASGVDPAWDQVLLLSSLSSRIADP